jgi:hypothetical protein
MECFIYLGQVGCEFDSQATAAWVQAMGTLIAIVVAAIFPYCHQRKLVASQKRDQAERILGLASLAHGPILEFVQIMEIRNFDVQEFAHAKSKLEEVEFIADRLDELRSSDCPSPELIRVLHEFRGAVRAFLTKFKAKNYFFYGQTSDLRASVLEDLEPQVEEIIRAYAEIMSEPNKYR